MEIEFQASLGSGGNWIVPVLGQPVDLLPVPIGACALLGLLFIILWVAILIYFARRPSRPYRNTRPTPRGFDVIPRPAQTDTPGAEPGTEPPSRA
jgi:hypothetical protein